MADDLATMQAQLAALKRARYSGVLVVTNGETSTTFKSDAQIAAAIAALEADIEVAAGTTPSRKVRYLYQAGKGL